jgi:hypothetical protein
MYLSQRIQSRYSDTCIPINNMQYIPAMEYYSVINRNKILINATWMNLEKITLNEICKTQKDKYSMFLPLPGT